MGSDIPEIDHYSYKPVGHCIYCGSSEDLRDEHIVPYGLGGNMILPKSSCGACAVITSKFEFSVMRGSFWDARIYRKIQSRRKHKKAPKLYPITMSRNGTNETIEVSLDEYPIILPFPLFSVPGYLNLCEQFNGIKLEGIASVSFGVRPEVVLEKYGAEHITPKPITDKPVDFARMIAKIALSMAIAEGALNEIDADQILVLPAILGESDDIGQWVGTITEPIASHEEHLHRVLIHRDEEKGLLLGDVQLFSDSETPRYGVILGVLRQ